MSFMVWPLSALHMTLFLKKTNPSLGGKSVILGLPVLEGTLAPLTGKDTSSR